MQARSILIALLALGPLTAQSVTTSLSAATNIVCSVSGFVLAGDVVPAGPLPTTGNCSATLSSIGTGVATTSWELIETPTGSMTRMRNLLSVAPNVNFTARARPQEFLLEYSSPIPAGARLEISQQLAIGPYTLAPYAQVDLGNDGNLDIFNLSQSGPITVPVTSLGSTPFAVRIILHSEHSGPGWSDLEVTARLVPDVPIDVSKTATSCLNEAGFTVAPTFTNSGVLVTSTFLPSVTVFGFGLNPLLLPPATTGPCLLLPTPDVLVLMTPGQPFSVALPAAVRPIVFHAQLAVVTPQGILTSDAYQIVAW